MKKEIDSVFKSVFCGVFILSAFFFISEYSAYRPETPKFVGSLAVPFLGEGLQIQAKAYDSSESQAYLSHDLIKMGFKPVQVTIQNNTKNTYFLSSSNVDIATETTGKVTSYVTARGIPKSIAFKVAGFLFWPFLIPGAIDTVITIKSHVDMKSDFYAKSIKEEGESIVPYSTVNRILFVPEAEYSNAFTIHFKDAKNGSCYPYPVKINS